MLKNVENKPKHNAENLIPAFRKAAKFRNEIIQETSINDNGGAIYAAERILDILGQRFAFYTISASDGL